MAAQECVAQGKGKREVMALVVAAVRAAFPGMDDEGVKVIGWSVYEQMAKAAQ